MCHHLGQCRATPVAYAVYEMGISPIDIINDIVNRSGRNGGHEIYILYGRYYYNLIGTVHGEIKTFVRVC